MKKSNWGYKGLADWARGDTAYLSAVFSWNMDDVYQKAIWYKSMGYKVIAGGPAVMMNREYLSGVAEIGENYEDAIRKHNPNATYTSRGCLRKCEFCVVPKIEGDLVELAEWPVRPIICDNNLLACSKKHFDGVVDKLGGVSGVDFNQGLDARLMTKYHVDRLMELDLSVLRLAWDHTKMEKQFMRAFEMIVNAGFPAKKIRVYVLIGWRDNPEDALYRLETVKNLGAYPNPMRFQPLGSKRKNEYVGENWTDRELKRYARYWSRLSYLEHVPFSEYDQSKFRRS